MISYNLLKGDSLKVLRDLTEDPNEKGKYRVIITSPPYYGHRHYGKNGIEEVGHEKTDQEFVDKLSEIFGICRDLLAEDGSLWIVIGDTRRNNQKLMIPHRLAMKLVEKHYTFREDVVWYKKNSVASSAKNNLSQAYEFILFLSKNDTSYTNLDLIRVGGNEVEKGGIRFRHQNLYNISLSIPTRKKLLSWKRLYIIQNQTRRSVRCPPQARYH
jgi:DNA modification methylase